MPINIVIPSDLNSDPLSRPHNYNNETESDKINIIYRRIVAIKDNIERLAFIVCIGTALSATCLIYIIVLHDRLSKMNDNILGRFDTMNNMLSNITHT